MEISVFVKENEKNSKDFILGLKLRRKLATALELPRFDIRYYEFDRDPVKDTDFLLGLAYTSSADLTKINDLDEKILIFPVSPVVNGNIVPIFLTEWEAEAVKYYINQNYYKPEECSLLTDLKDDSSYLKIFTKKLNIPDPDRTANKAAKKQCVVIVGDNKFSLLRKLYNVQKGNKEFVITTSSIEEPSMSKMVRKQLAGVHYVYPKISAQGRKIVEEFSREFGRPPHFVSLLAYEMLNLAYKVLSVIDIFSYEKFIDAFLEDEFDLTFLGKVKFIKRDNAIIPYIPQIDSSPEEFFDLKFIDEKGEFKTNKEG